VNNSQARVEEIFAEAARLFETKNLTYQDSWRTQGWRGNLSRILEKAGRLRAMLWRGGNVLLNGSKEHPRETLLDIINTSAFLIINMDDGVEWGHEPQAKEIYPSSVVQTPADVVPNELTSYTNTLVPYSEETRTDLPIVGEVPTPGEDAGEERRPSPRKRGAAVTDRGSGPRQKPQA
jgi:hypothetical protein